MVRKQSARDVIVACRSGSHKVRLGKGLRFWKSARCPKCGSAVDPSRWRRIGRWLGNLGRPLSTHLSHRLACWGSLAFLAFALLNVVLLWGFGDRWWPATTLLFGPRWVLGLPILALLPAAFVWDRGMLAPVFLSAVTIAGPVVGLRTGWRQLFVQEESASDIRVVSFNARGGAYLALSPLDLLLDWNADIAAFQECGSALSDGLRALEGWHSHVLGRRLCMVSRFELESVQEMDREAFEFAGGSGLVVTYRLDPGGHPFFLTNLHLETPRAGLELIRVGRIEEGVAKTDEKSFLREVELRRARAWVAQFPGPHLVVGDFNTPPESRSYRAAWSDWQNAFSRMGRGLGGTRLNGWIRARIDHVLANEHWEVVRAKVGRDVGSDHLPMIATVRMR